MAGLRPTSIPVRTYRCLRLVFHFLWIAMGAALIYPCVGDKQRDRLKQRWSHQILRILAIRLDLEATDAPPGSIVVDPWLFGIFALACVVGYYVVWNVTHALHTPLMSVTNAISGIIIVGAMTQLASDSYLVKIIAAVAVLLASINVFGGFAVTQRMLAMFRK